MKNFGLATSKKHTLSIATKYIPDKLPKTYYYHIDNDYVTFNEICARLPHIKPGTLRNRIDHGWNHWESLGQPPRQITQKQRNSGAYFGRVKAWSKTIAKDKVEYFKKKKEGHAKL